MEENDKLRDFIRQNKTDFDEPKFDKHKIWNALEDQLFEQQKQMTKVIPLYKKNWLRVAAAAVIVGVVIFTYKFTNQPKQENQICAIDGVPAQFCSQVSNYEETLLEKFSKLDKEKLKQIQMPDEVLKEVELNNPEQQKLLKDLKNNPQNQYIQEAIIDYYKAKLKLIDRIEETIQQHPKKQNNEKENTMV
ncbi:MAG: hypothetical protein U0U67_05270 [Chitinophagales bacterium]